MTAPADRLARAAARHEGENGEARALIEQALARLSWRLRRSRETLLPCNTEKPIGDFSRDSRKKDGIQRYCRQCDFGVNAAAYERRQARALLWWE